MYRVAFDGSRYDIVQHGLEQLPWYDFWFTLDGPEDAERMRWDFIRPNAARWVFWSKHRWGRAFQLEWPGVETQLPFYDEIYRDMVGLDAALAQAQREARARPATDRTVLVNDWRLAEFADCKEGFSCASGRNIVAPGRTEGVWA